MLSIAGPYLAVTALLALGGGLKVVRPTETATALAALGLPTVIVQEGGYLCDDLGRNLASFLTGFGGKHKL